MQRRKRLMLAALVTLTLLVSGCTMHDSHGEHGEDGHHDGGHHDGHGDGHHGGQASTTGAGNLEWNGTEDRTFNVTAGVPFEYRFSPDVLNVTAGERIGIVFANQGSIDHEFSIDAIEFHLHVAAGGSERGAFLAPEPGTYTYACYISGHHEAGMRGTLNVEAA